MMQKSTLKNSFHQYLLVFSLFLITLNTGCKNSDAVTLKNDNLKLAVIIDELMSEEDSFAIFYHIVWTKTPSGPITYLIASKGAKWETIGHADGIIAPINNNIYKITNEEKQFSICACSSINIENEEEICTEQYETQSNVPIIHNITKGETIYPFDFLKPQVHDPETFFLNFALDFETSGTIGNYIFFNMSIQRTYCEQNKSEEIQRFAIFNLEKAKLSKILEQSSINDDLQFEFELAQKQLQNNRTMAETNPTVPILTQVKPKKVSNLGFTLDYTFTNQQQKLDQNENWETISNSIFIEATNVPAQLKPFLLAPLPIRTILEIQNNDEVGGWWTIKKKLDSKNKTLLLDLFEK